MLKKTPLNALHHELVARMVDFGGWEMPVHYGSQIEEHRAVRTACGIFDVSHMCPIDLHGTEIRPFLSRLLANDVSRLKEPGKALYSCMLNDTGGVIDDLIVYYLDETHFRLVVNAGTATGDILWMERKIKELNFNVRLTERRDLSAHRPLAIIAVQGPQAAEILWRTDHELLPSCSDMPPFFARQIGELFVAHTGYTGEDGFEVMLPADQAPAFWQQLIHQGARPCGLGSRDTLRLEAGMNLYGQDMDASISPLDAGLAWTVSANTGRDFIGKTALLSAGQKKQFLGLRLLSKGVLRAHQKVITPFGDGETTSGTFSPTTAQSIAFARLPLSCKTGDTVQVDIRGKLLDAEVVRPVFVRQGKSLI